MKINIKSLFKAVWALFIPGCMALSSCTAEPDESNRFTFTGETIYDFLANNDSTFGNFNYILRRAGQDRILSSYGTYTCFAPNNRAVMKYIDSLYNDRESVDDAGVMLHNGMTENSLEGLTDSLCEDIAMFHLLKNTVTTTEMLTSTGATYRTLLGRYITAGSSGGQILVNSNAAINRNMCDYEVVNGIVHAVSGVIQRSNKLVARELQTDSLRFSIFYEALDRTGLDKELETQMKTLTAEAPSAKDGYYIPKECKKGFTVFAETNDVFHANGINDFNDLVEKCKEWYGKAAAGPRSQNSGWYDYFRNNGIEVDMSDNYTKYNNVVNMFVRYHILKTAVNAKVLAFDNNIWNADGYSGDAYDYYETMLPKTILKAWKVKKENKVYLNRYVANNTLTDGVETLGSPSIHPLVSAGVEVDVDSIKQPINGYIYPIKSILVYDGKVPFGVLNERMRFDALSILGETMDNGFRGAYVKEVTAMNSGKGAARVRFPVDYFDNVKVFNGNNTQIDMNLVADPGSKAYTLYKGDSFQGMGVFDFAIKLPPVPDGTYELRINLDCMQHGTMLQAYIGGRPEISAMQPLDIPLDMRMNMSFDDPALQAMGCVPINDEANYPDSYADRGIESDRVMRTHKFLRGPLSIVRQNPYERGYVSRYVPHQLRRILDTRQFKQQDYWLRLKTVLEDGNLERKFQIDYIEFVPVDVAQSQQYLEDMY